jgi:hypothetical protein
MSTERGEYGAARILYEGMLPRLLLSVLQSTGGWSA